MTKRNDRFVSPMGRANSLSSVGRGGNLISRNAAEAAVVIAPRGRGGAYPAPQLSEGYFWVEPDGTFATDLSDAFLFDGVASEIHAVGGPSAKVPVLSGGWNDPDDIFRRIFGESIVELCRVDNLEGSIVYSTFIDAPNGVLTGATDAIVSLDTFLNLMSFGFDGDGFKSLTTMGFVDTDANLSQLYKTGTWYPIADGGDGSGNKTGNTQFHVALVMHRLANVGNWVDLYIDANIVRSDFMKDTVLQYRPDATRGITVWADMPTPLGDDSVLVTATARLMNRDVLSLNKTHSLLIKRYGSDRTDHIPTIIRDHYRDKNVMPASAL